MEQLVDNESGERGDARLTQEILMLEREREGSFHVRAGHRERVPSKLLDCYCLVCKGMLKWRLARYFCRERSDIGRSLIVQQNA